MRMIEAMIISKKGICKMYFNDEDELKKFASEQEEKKVIIPKWVEVEEHR